MFATIIIAYKARKVINYVSSKCLKIREMYDEENLNQNV
jgi:hypothetical protein